MNKYPDKFKENDKLFNEIVDTFYRAYRNIPLKSRKPWRIKFYNAIQSKGLDFSMDREDIEQEVALLWLKYPQDIKHDVGRYRFYSMSTIFDLLNTRPKSFGWSDRLSKPNYTEYQQYLEVVQEERTQELTEVKKDDPWTELKLDSNFLINGCMVLPFHILSLYERYLIYLKYKEGLSPEKIKDLLYCHIDTITLHLKATEKKLRDYIQENK